jgi:hypothetical protein
MPSINDVKSVKSTGVLIVATDLYDNVRSTQGDAADVANIDGGPLKFDLGTAPYNI